MRTNNITFKGYDNILCAFDIPAQKNQRVSLITMRLNDEGEHKDLTELRKIKQMQGLQSGSENENLLTITYVDGIPQNSETLYFNNKSMYWGDELLHIEENYVPKLITKEDYQKLKTIQMKEYTLMANLTSRMTNAKFDGENEAIKYVIKNLFETMSSILKDPISAFHVTNIACLKQFKFQQIALAFNQGICKTMNRYFKG